MKVISSVPAKKITILLLCAGFGAIAAGSIFLSMNAVQQDRRNRELILAIRRNDAVRAIDLLNWGADPNTHEYQEHRPSRLDVLIRYWRKFLNRTIEPERDPGLPAILLLLAEKRDADGEVIQPPENAGILQALLAHGADCNCQDRDDFTPLWWACAWNYGSSTRLLLEHGANPNICREGSPTPVMLCANLGDLATLRLLIDHHADLNVRTETNDTALHWAVGSGDAAKVKALVDAGAQDYWVDYEGKSPLDCAILNKQWEIVRLFKKHGQSP